MQAIIEELGHTIHGINAPFACGGTLVPSAPVTIALRDGPHVALTRVPHLEQAEQLRPLLDGLEPAPFGKGRRTVRDRRVCARWERFTKVSRTHA